MKPAPRTKVALYLRVSTEEQTEAQQHHALAAEVARRGWEVVGVYRERLSAKRGSERPEHSRLMQDAALRRFGAVMVWSIDRFSRSLLELLGYMEKLEARGVAFASLREPVIDTSTAAGKLILSIMGAVAEFERNRLSERTREAMARVKREGSKSGKPIGRPAAKLSLAYAAELLGRGMPKAEVARVCRVSIRTLERRLQK